MTETTNFFVLFMKHLNAAAIFYGFLLSPIIGWPLLIFLMATEFWWLAVLYLLWYYADLKTPEQGGRPISWIQNAPNWKMLKTYFNPDVIFAPGFSLDPKRNYLFCYCPHGIVSGGLYLNMLSGAGKFSEVYPNFKVTHCTLKLMFLGPFLREWIMGLGFMSCSAAAINFVLGKPEGGHIVCLNVGGAEEAYYSHPGKYCCIVKKRKGFIKAALRHGSPVVPVITFGETDMFYQAEFGVFKTVQEVIRKKFHFAPILFYGKGVYFKYGIFPRRVPLKTVVGIPIEVLKTESPTTEQIDELQEKYIKALVNLFETYKHQFLENPNETSLVLK